MTHFEDSRDSILIPLAIPPSSNNQYLLARRGNKIYHVPSRELKAFQRNVQEYPWKFPYDYARSKKKIREWLDQKKILEIHCIFFMKQSRLYTKKFEPKRMDVSNRIKSCHDSVCKMLQIDDSIFFRITAEKCIAHEGIAEMTCVEITPLR